MREGNVSLDVQYVQTNPTRVTWGLRGTDLLKQHKLILSDGLLGPKHS